VDFSDSAFHHHPGSTVSGPMIDFDQTLGGR